MSEFGCITLFMFRFTMVIDFLLWFVQNQNRFNQRQLNKLKQKKKSQFIYTYIYFFLPLLHYFLTSLKFLSQETVSSKNLQNNGGSGCWSPEQLWFIIRWRLQRLRSILWRIHGRRTVGVGNHHCKRYSYHSPSFSNPLWFRLPITETETKRSEEEEEEEEFWIHYPYLKSFLSTSVAQGLIPEYYVYERAKLIGEEKAKELNERGEALFLKELEACKDKCELVASAILAMKSVKWFSWKLLFMMIVASWIAFVLWWNRFRFVFKLH